MRRIVIVTPAPPGSRHGNRTTAHRWRRILSDLGHQVAIQQEWDGRSCDLLVALHGRRSFASIRRFHRTHPERPLVVVLAGTDITQEPAPGKQVQEAMQMADRLVVLQPEARRRIPPSCRPKTRVIYQSVAARKKMGPSRKARTFDVCVLAHLRPVKDPLLTARASRQLPEASRIRVILVGGSMSQTLASRARSETRKNPRLVWRGEVPHWQALNVLGRSQLLVISSKREGGANVVSEALAAVVPILATRIPGNVGLLGADHPGLFPVGDDRRLSVLLNRAETSPEFLGKLRKESRLRRHLTDPARERLAWKKLLQELDCLPFHRRTRIRS